MKVCVFSDVHHNSHSLVLPKSDIALFCGDCSFRGDQYEFLDFINWFAIQDVTEKIFVPGNHDRYTENQPEEAKKYANDCGVHYLVDNGIELCGLKFWGTPIQPSFCGWAWNVWDYKERDKHYDLIPSGLDFLITHCPPHGILDKTPPSKHNRFKPERVGCGRLLKAIQRAKPKYSVFGHIHGAYGSQKKYGIQFINASICDERYRMVNPPIVVSI